MKITEKSLVEENYESVISDYQALIDKAQSDLKSKSDEIEKLKYLTTTSNRLIKQLDSMLNLGNSIIDYKNKQIKHYSYLIFGLLISLGLESLLYLLTR